MRLSPLLFMAGGFALGIAVGLWQPSSSPRPWLFSTAPLLIVGVCALRHAPTTILITIQTALAMMLGAAWTSIRIDHIPSDNIAAWLGEDSQLVHVEAIALGRSETRTRTAGSLAMFDYRKPSTVAPIRIESLHTHDGERVAVRGKAYLRIAETCEPFRRGDRISATGFLVPFGPPHNPGEFDFRRYARALNQAGMLNVSNRELISIEPAQRLRLLEQWLTFRDELRRRADGLLLARLPHSESTHRNVLLRALLLGQREPEFDAIADPFKRLGIAHLLAISGLHLGILAAVTLVLFRAIGLPLRTQALLVALIVLVYLSMIELRLPVLRAGIMALAACAGLALGRQWAVGGLIALSAIALMMWRPDQITNAGFQLSFGVVLGLVYLSPRLHERIWGPSAGQAAIYSSAQMVGAWAKGAITVSITSWLIATPIIMYHFGIIAPLGVVLSVPAVPMVGLLLILGYVKMILELVSPSFALFVGVPVSILADMLISIVLAIDELPGTIVYAPFPSAAWTFAALGFVCVMLLWRSTRLVHRGALAAAGIALILHVTLPLLQIREQPALRLDALSVGHGACYVIRSGKDTFVFDAGSMTNYDIGRQTIIPAMRRLGVRSIQTIAISHPHIDHYSALIELVDEFRVGQVLLTHQFIEHAREYPDSAVAYTLDQLVQRQVRVRPIVQGESMAIGSALAKWLHPPKNLEEFGRDNEHSMVVRLDIGDRRLILTGDVERQGLAKLVERQRDLRACIVELPHHGSFNPLAAAFITQLDPQITLQSSSRTQLRRDRWDETLHGVERLITARDGAITIEISRHGEIAVQRFLQREQVQRSTMSRASTTTP